MSSSAFNDTSRRLNQAGAARQTKEDQLTILKDKPFWIWDKKHYFLKDIPDDANCCFNHIVGLPQKDGHYMPLLPYEYEIINAILKYRRLVVLKSRGIGLSELLIRWYIYSAINRFPSYSNLLIIAGNREKIAIDLLNRCKRILTQKMAPGYFDDSNLTTAQIGTITIEVMPARVQDIRGKNFVKSVWCDEADYFNPQQSQYEVRPAIEGLMSKPNSNPEVIFSSTPRGPGSLMDTLMREENNFYHKLTFPYTAGIKDKKGNLLPFPIYSEAELKQNRLSPNWRQEYECDFIGQAGNIVDPFAVDKVAELGKHYKSEIIPGATCSIGVDPPGGGGGSAFAVVVTQLQKNQNGKNVIVVTHIENHANTVTWEFAVARVANIVERIGYTPSIFVDVGGGKNFMQSLRYKLGEPTNEISIEATIANCKKHSIPLYQNMNIIPVPFGIEGIPMTMHLKSIVEAKDRLAINPYKFQPLIIAIRAARATNHRYTKDSESLYPDLFDGLRMALSLYKFKP